MRRYLEVLQYLKLWLTSELLFTLYFMKKSLFLRITVIGKLVRMQYREAWKSWVERAAKVPHDFKSHDFQSYREPNKKCNNFISELGFYISIM